VYVGARVCLCLYMRTERERERERERVEAMEMQHVEGKLSTQTTPREEGPHASKESKRGGWITFPFITGFSLSLSGCCNLSSFSSILGWSNSI
jgi:hypothetical protein